MQKERMPPPCWSEYFPLVVQFASLLPPKLEKTFCHVTLKKRSYFSLFIRQVLYNLMIIQAVPLGLKNIDSDTIVTKPADIMEGLSVGFPRRKGF